MSTQNYTVELQRSPEGSTVRASVRDFELTIGSKARDMSVGFNPVEALLSASGACLTSSLGLVAQNSGVTIEDVRLQATATRQDDPPKLVALRIEIELSSAAPDDKLANVLRIASKATTVVSTLREALDVSIAWRRVGADDAGWTPVPEPPAR